MISTEVLNYAVQGAEDPMTVRAQIVECDKKYRRGFWFYFETKRKGTQVYYFENGQIRASAQCGRYDVVAVVASLKKTLKSFCPPNTACRY